MKDAGRSYDLAASEICGVLRKRDWRAAGVHLEGRFNYWRRRLTRALREVQRERSGSVRADKRRLRAAGVRGDSFVMQSAQELREIERQLQRERARDFDPNAFSGDLFFECEECGEWKSDVLADRVGLEGRGVCDACAQRISEKYCGCDDVNAEIDPTCGNDRCAKCCDEMCSGCADGKPVRAGNHGGAK